MKTMISKATRLMAVLMIAMMALAPGQTVLAEKPVYKQDNVRYHSAWENLREFTDWYASDAEHRARLYPFLDEKTDFAFSLFYHALCDGYLGIDSVNVRNGYMWGIIRVSDGNQADYYGSLITTRQSEYYYIEYAPDVPGGIRIMQVRFRVY